MTRSFVLFSLLCSLSFSAGCTRSGELPPLTTPSTGKPAYAARYSENLAATRGTLAQQENKAERTMGEMSQFSSSIEPKDWNHVRTVYQLADSSGKSADYFDRYEENQSVSTFFEEEKQNIQNGVVGSTQYSAKQNTCKDPDQVGSSALHGLNKAVDKSLQDRLRSRNEAHDYITAHRAAIGEKSVEKLKEQADKISETAFIVYVGTENNRRKLKAMVGEAADVKKTLQRSIELDSKMVVDASQPEADRKAAQARATAENDSLSKIDGELQQTEHVLTELDQRMKKLQDDYQQALKALLESVDAKIKASK